MKWLVFPWITSNCLKDVNICWILWEWTILSEFNEFLPLPWSYGRMTLICQINFIDMYVIIFVDAEGSVAHERVSIWTCNRLNRCLSDIKFYSTRPLEIKFYVLRPWSKVMSLKHSLFTHEKWPRNRRLETFHIYVQMMLASFHIRRVGRLVVHRP